MLRAVTAAVRPCNAPLRSTRTAPSRPRLTDASTPQPCRCWRTPRRSCAVDRKLEEAARDLGDAATAIPTDVTSTREVDHLIARTIDLHGRIDILIANAGIYAAGDFVANDVTQLLQLIDTNVGGVVRTIHATLKYMIAAGTGDIVVTSSVSGHQSIHWEPVYSASKHAVQALTHGLRRQLVGSGVRIGAIAPGVVLNDLWQVTDAATVADGVATGTGLTSEDVANVVAYMLTLPRHINIRDLVMLPINQEI